MCKLAGTEGLPDHVKNRLNSCRPWINHEFYKELPKGKLLFENIILCANENNIFPDCKIEKEYINLSTPVSKEYIKKVMEEKGNLVGHPEIPSTDVGCDTQVNYTKLYEEEKTEKTITDDLIKLNVLNRITNYLSHNSNAEIVNYDRHTQKLIVKEVETKFDMRQICEAVKALSLVIPTKEAERLICKEIATKIKNVL